MLVRAERLDVGCTGSPMPRTRDPRMNLRALLEPQSVAIVGASERPGPGRRVLENLQQIGFQGEIIPVNPKYEKVCGLPCHPSLSRAVRAGKQVDAAAILVGRDRVVEIIEEAAYAGVRGIWALASGFAEAGEGGRLLQNQAAAVCRSHGIALCGPNSVGYLNPLFGSAVYGAAISPMLRPGPIGVVSQSGAVCLALANSGRGLGFRLLVSSGNEAVIDSADYMEFLLRDPRTDVILAFIEELRRPQRFLDVARLGQRLQKPIVVLKLGRSALAQRTAQMHTGALAGTDKVYDAIFRKFGVIRVDDIDEMLETAAAFAGVGGRLPRGNRVGMLSASGGEIGLIADHSQGLGLTFPSWSNAARIAFAGVLPDYVEFSNPLDAWGSGRVEQTYPACIDAAAKEDVDLLVVSQDAPRGLPDEQAAEACAIARAAGRTKKESGLPIVAISHLSGGVHGALQEAFRDGGIPLLQGTRPGLRAIHHLIEFSQRRKMDCGTSQPRRARRGGYCFPENGGVLEHVSARRLLKEYGIRGPRESVASGWEEAVRVADLIGYPVMLSAVLSELPRETGHELPGSLATDEASVRVAAQEIAAGIRALDPEAEAMNVLVQEVIPDPVAEIVLGLISDPSFGPFVVLGLQGGEGELLREAVLGVPPLSRHEALEMLEQAQVNRILRDSPVQSMESLLDAVEAMGRLAADWGDRLASLEVHPLVVRPEGLGVVAVHVRVEAAVDVWMPWDGGDVGEETVEWTLREGPMSGSREAATVGRKVAS